MSVPLIKISMSSAYVLLISYLFAQMMSDVLLPFQRPVRLGSQNVLTSVFILSNAISIRVDFCGLYSIVLWDEHFLLVLCLLLAFVGLWSVLCWCQYQCDSKELIWDGVESCVGLVSSIDLCWLWILVFFLSFNWFLGLFFVFLLKLMESYSVQIFHMLYRESWSRSSLCMMWDI